MEPVPVPLIDEALYPSPAETETTKDIPATLGAFAGLALDHSHLGVAVREPCEDPRTAELLKDVNPQELFDELLGKTELFTEDVFLFAIDYDGHHSFSSVDDLQPNISAICSYAEDNPSAAPDVKLKLRYAAKECLEKRAVSALPFLAMHGSVCNLQKEIGIRALYACLANVAEDNDIANRVRRLLVSFREQQLERMYVAQEERSWRGEERGVGKVDSHDLINYRNMFSEYIGLPRIPDPDISEEYELGTVAIYFRRFYTIESVSNYIWQCANVAPRRLDYHAVVAFLRYNRPEKWGASDADEFLFHCFDDGGNFTMGCVYWLLFKLGVFKSVWAPVDVEKLFPPLDEIRLSRSRENVLLRSREAIHHADAADELRMSMEHLPLSKSHEHRK